jgi:membrane protease subunit HflK
MDDRFKDAVDNLKRGLSPKGTARAIAGGLALIVLIVLVATSYYQVEPNERGVVLRFGRYVKSALPGPHLKIAFGVDKVYLVKTDYQFKEEFGFRTDRAGVRSHYSEDDYTKESDMLTGDQNIATVTWVVQYRIRDPRKYLFAVRDVPGTIRDVSEATMRAVVGDESFNEVIRLKRQAIELAVKDRMQKMLDLYNCGVDIKLVQLQDVHPPAPVKDSFDEVNRARQEMDQAINQAYQEYNKVIYRVKGEAEQTVKEAEGTRVERINRAKGDAARFTKLLREYRKAPEVTRRRLFLETMRQVLPRLRQVYVVDESLKNMMPLLDFRSAGTTGKKGGAQ